HQRDLRISVDEMLERIADLVPRHEGVDIYYWPYQREVTLRIWDPTDAPATVATRKTFARVYGHAAFAVFHAWEQWVMRTWPRTTPAIATFNYRWFPFFDRVTDVVEAVHWRDAIEMLRVSCVEFAFKLDDDFATFRRAWRDAIAVVDAYAARGLYPFNMTINARFIGTSDCLLAPASGPGQTCYIEILSSSPTPHWQEFTSEIAHAWMELPGARPHWAKEWEYIPGIVPFLGRAYGAQLEQFLWVREELGVDPQRMFSNALLDRVLFENPALGAAEPPVAVAEPPTPVLAERH
ncbi:MAG: D-arabinono-1,4-lactone oxidase, partial [Thermomicrobiales bacterium]